MKSKKENILIFISGIIFLVFYAVCSFYNRFAVDDYYYIHNTNKLGVFGNMLNDYNHWGGRWSVNLLWSLLYLNYNVYWVLPLVTIVLFIIFYSAIFLSLKKTLTIFFPQLSSRKYQSHLLAIIFVQFVFFVSPDKGEIWLWSVSSFTYLLSVSCFLAGFSLILSENKIKLFSSSIIILCFAYAGGACESYAINYFIFIALSAIYLLKIFKLFSPISRKIILKRLIFYSIFLLISFIISAVSPGDVARKQILQEPSIVKGIVFSIKTLYHILFLNFLPNFFYFILFIIPSFYFGSFLFSTEKEKIFKLFIRKIFISLILLVIVTVLMIFPMCYTLSDIAPSRGLSQVIILWATFFSAWAFILGANIKISKKINSTTFKISILLIILNVFIVGLSQIPIITSYSKALDERTSMLKKLQRKGNTKTITLEKLPPSGFLYSAEISADTNYFGNEHYKLGLFLDFKVNISKDK